MFLVREESNSKVLGPSRSWAYRARLSTEYAGVMGRLPDGIQVVHPSIHVWRPFDLRFPSCVLDTAPLFLRLKFIVARDELWQSFSQGMILYTYSGPAVLGGSLTKPTCVVLRLPSGVLKTQAGLRNSKRSSLSCYLLHIILEYAWVPPYTNST